MPAMLVTTDLWWHDEDKAALVLVICSRSLKTKSRKRLSATQAELVRHAVYTGCTDMMHKFRSNIFRTVYITICLRYVITTIRFISLGWIRKFADWSSNSTKRHNCKGHCNDIALFRGGKHEMSNHWVATSSCKLSSMLGAGETQCFQMNNGRYLSEWEVERQRNKQKPAVLEDFHRSNDNAKIRFFWARLHYN